MAKDRKKDKEETVETVDAETVEDVEAEAEGKEVDSEKDTEEKVIDAEVVSEETQELNDRILRLQADFQNYKRRAEKEKIETIRYANEKLILQILEVVDNFERALQTDSEKDGFYDGVEMIYEQLLKVLQNNEVETIEEMDCPFDPKLHNAVLTGNSAEIASGNIMEVLQKGYKIKDRVIRPAMVKVAN